MKCPFRKTITEKYVQEMYSNTQKPTGNSTTKTTEEYAGCYGVNCAAYEDGICLRINIAIK